MVYECGCAFNKFGISFMELNGMWRKGVKSL